MAAAPNMAGPNLSGWVLVPGMLALAGCWYGLYRLGKRASGDLGGRIGIIPLALGRLVVAAALLWLGLLLLGRVLLLATNWPIWPVAAVSAIAAEALVWLYGLERRVLPRRLGLLLVGLRLGLLALAALMLVQPVLASIWTKTSRRNLAVLLDTSASMQVADRQLAAHEKLRLAESLSVEAARRPYRLAQEGQTLRQVRDRLAVELAWMDRLAQGKSETALAQLRSRRKELGQDFQASAAQVGQSVAQVQKVLERYTSMDQPMKAALLDLKAALGNQLGSKLTDIAGMLADDQAGKLGENLARMREILRKVLADSEKAPAELAKRAEELDAAIYSQLSPADRAVVDGLAELPRQELAKAALLHRAAQVGKQELSSSLLSCLAQQYNLKVYTFDSTVQEVQFGAWPDPSRAVVQRGGATSLKGDQPPTQAASAQVSSTSPSRPATQPGLKQDVAIKVEPARQQTQFAAALKKVLAETDAKDLAGVVLLTEGQDHSSEPLEPLARQIGAAGGAVCSVMLGSEKPPIDAAIISVDAPDTLYLDDKTYITAELKLDGLDKKDVQVTLFDDKRPVDSQTIRVIGEVCRTRLQLSDQPGKVGLHRYRIEISKLDGEVFYDNNDYALTLSVTNDRTKLLLIDGRPRWEYRYLKNLFSGRDKTVQLQYVLLEPDAYFGQPPRPKVPASAARPMGQEEATTLPEKEEEWLKFDVIVLGDVAAKHLDEKALKSLKRFVSDRGGTLIVIAGPRHMPAEYVDSPLAELIPLKLKDVPLASRPASKPTGATPVSLPEAAPPEAELSLAGFKLAMTAQGKEHVIFRQDVQPERNSQVWESIPSMYWRSPFVHAAAHAQVLAYALDSDAPRWLSSNDEQALADSPATLPEHLAKLREEYQRQHALVSLAAQGLGKVMMLSFDQSWRLRYRVGDTYHHKFWGQVMRWATAGKLPAGGHLVKLGTDRTRYAPHDKPLVRAKLVKEDFTPLISDSVAVKVLQEEKLLARLPMKYVPDSPGLYSVSLGELPPGVYRLELDAPAAAELLAKEGVQTVKTEISVDPSAPIEQVELAANRDLLNRLASLGASGVVVPVWEAAKVLDSLPGGQVVQSQRKQFALWDSWLLLGLFCALATAEWVLRKRAGLA